MTEALPWAVVIPNYLYLMFIYYQMNHAMFFHRAWRPFQLILVLTVAIGMITGIVFLVYYGFKVVWWAPFVLIGFGLGFKFVSNIIEDMIGMFALSMLGFVGLPVCAFLMFTSVPNLEAHDHEMDNLSRFIATIESANFATRVVNKGTAFSVMSEADTDEMIRHYRVALSYAEKVDTDLLNQKYDGWGSHFEKEFLTGLRLVVEGNNKADVTMFLAGQKLLESWGDWFNNNVNEIRKLR